VDAGRIAGQEASESAEGGHGDSQGDGRGRGDGRVRWCLIKNSKFTFYFFIKFLANQNFRFYPCRQSTYSIVEKPTETQISIRLASQLVRVPQLQFAGHLIPCVVGTRQTD
jgi:hypothetical protein